jgi:hypothetical protein
LHFTSVIFSTNSLRKSKPSLRQNSSKPGLFQVPSSAGLYRVLDIPLL